MSIFYDFHSLEVVGRDCEIQLQTGELLFNPFNPEFTIVIFIHYKPRIAVAILDL